MERDIIYELHTIKAGGGAVVKITAVDVLTMTEVVVQGPANAGETALKQVALNKLLYVLRKNGKIAE